MSRTFALIVTLLCLVTACGDDDGGLGGSAGSPPGGAGGAAAGSSGASGSSASSAGGTSAGMAGKNAAAGGGGSAAGGSAGGLTTEELKQATYTECEGNCELVQEACHSNVLTTCIGSCHDQADNAASTGQCGPELYGALKCATSTQTASDITCTASGPDYAGCKAELMAYYACVGGP